MWTFWVLKGVASLFLVSRLLFYSFYAIDFANSVPNLFRNSGLQLGWITFNAIIVKILKFCKKSVIF